jgi:hypothetical protein
MSEKPVAKAIKAGKLKGSVSGKDNGDVEITDSTANLARFVSNADRTELFAEKFGEFKRIDGTPDAPQKAGGKKATD